MRRWEFDSIAQAVRSISSWFPGSIKEQIILKEHLDDALGIHQSQKTANLEKLQSEFVHDFIIPFCFLGYIPGPLTT